MNDIIELAVIIVNFNLGSKVLRIARQHGIKGGTIFHGMGTMKNRILQFFELAESRKEIVLLAAEADVLAAALEQIDKEFCFEKPNHGIAFTISLTVWMGNERAVYSYNKDGGEPGMYSLIMAIVQRGKAGLVIEAAREAGARGGTVIRARGAGQAEANKLFNMEIEPEREVVIFVAESERTERITTALGERMEIDKIGNAAIFCQDIRKVYGIY
jgi:nitrogen regulatory protein PII